MCVFINIPSNWNLKYISIVSFTISPVKTKTNASDYVINVLWQAYQYWWNSKWNRTSVHICMLKIWINIWWRRWWGCWRWRLWLWWWQLNIQHLNDFFSFSKKYVFFEHRWNLESWKSIIESTVDRRLLIHLTRIFHNWSLWWYLYLSCREIFKTAQIKFDWKKELEIFRNGNVVILF